MGLLAPPFNIIKKATSGHMTTITATPPDGEPLSRPPGSSMEKSAGVRMASAETLINGQTGLEPPLNSLRLAVRVNLLICIIDCQFGLCEPSCWILGCLYCYSEIVNLVLWRRCTEIQLSQTLVLVIGKREHNQTCAGYGLGKIIILHLISSYQIQLSSAEAQEHYEVLVAS